MLFGEERSFLGERSLAGRVFVVRHDKELPEHKVCASLSGQREQMRPQLMVFFAD